MPQNQSNHWLSHSIIYQLFAGRLPTANIIDHPGQVLDHLTRLSLQPLLDHGINCIYLLGVWDNRGPIIVGEESGQDLSHQQFRLPSPFAISNHQLVNPDLGTNNSLSDLIAHWHDLGFKVILDFVPNHTSTTHPWVKDHPDYYHQKDGNHIAEFSQDVYKLDYTNPKLTNAMTQVLFTIAQLGADGVRCDMAHLVPLDFWRQATSQLKAQFPDFVFTAEVYPNSTFDLSILHHHLDAGFDAVYHGPLFNNLHATISHHQPLSHLADHLNFTLSDFSPYSLINYAANHDDPLPSGGATYLEALLSLILFYPGVPFIYNGLLNGLDHRLAHHYYDELPDQYHDFAHLPQSVTRLLQLRTSHHFQITGFSPTPTGLLVCPLTHPSTPHTLILNLSSTPQPLSSILSSHSHPSSTPGLLHQLTLSDPLPSGSAEILPLSVT